MENAELGVNDVDRLMDGMERPADPTPLANKPVKESSAMRRKNLLATLASRTHKPTLVLCPSQAVGVWIDEIKGHFPNISVKYWYSRPAAAPARAGHDPGRLDTR